MPAQPGSSPQQLPDSPAAATPAPPASPPEPTTPPPEPPLLPPEITPPEELSVEELNREAIEVAEQLLQRYPNSSDALALMGTVYDHQGKTAEATAHWQACLKIDPERADVYAALASVALEQDEYDRAVELSRQAAKLAPGAAGSYRDLGRALIAQGQVAEAVEVLRREIRQYPRARISNFLLAGAHLQLRQYEDAKRAYEAEIAIQPDFAKAYHGLMVVCARLGEKAESKQYAEKFRELDKTAWSEHLDRRGMSDLLDKVRGNVARTHADAGRIYARHADYDVAERLMRRAARIDPNNWSVRQEMANVYLLNGQRRRAGELCDELLEIDSDKAACYFNTGGLLVQLRRFDDAERVVRQGIELEPTHAAGYGFLVRVLLAAGRKPAEAIAAAKQLVGLQPTAANYRLLADACTKAGDQAGAADALQRAAELDGDGAAVPNALGQLR